MTKPVMPLFLFTRRLDIGPAHTSEMASIEAAIAEANSRLATAKHNAALAANLEQATELAEVLKTFVECGRENDAAPLIIIERSSLMEKTLHRMNQSGAASPNSRQLDSIDSRALITALMQTPWARAFRRIFVPANGELSTK